MVKTMSAAAVVCAAIAQSALGQFTVYEGNASVEASWRAALGGAVPLETFEGFRAVPSPFAGDSDFISGLPNLGLAFETDVPGTYLGIYGDSSYAHSGSNQLANFGGHMAQYSSFRILPAHPGGTSFAQG